MSHHFQQNFADFSDQSFSLASTTMTTTGNDLPRVEHMVQCAATSLGDTTTITDCGKDVQSGNGSCQPDNCDNDVTVLASLALLMNN